MFCCLELVDLSTTATNPQKINKQTNKQTKKRQKEKKIKIKEETRWIYQKILQCF